MVIARREPHLPGKGVVFVGPVTGAQPKQAATAAGLARSTDLTALRVEGRSRPVKAAGSHGCGRTQARGDSDGIAVAFAGNSGLCRSTSHYRVDGVRASCTRFLCRGR
jgi:hypothetical protein